MNDNPTATTPEKTFACEVTYHDLNVERLSVKSPKTGVILDVARAWFTAGTGNVVSKWRDAHEAHRAAAGGMWYVSTHIVTLTVDDLKAIKAAHEDMEATRKARTSRNRR